jgi:hypothetical protein
MSNDIKQNRVLEIALTLDESDDSALVTAINLRRDGFAGTAHVVPFTAGAAASAAQGGHIVALSAQDVQGFTHIKIIPTHQA